mmetsp:Transcript_22608/g.53367  ORF Transcript_22608/g.53367 Transcript_22608/m.53367 type:complete len:130 (-) Transcript_22608:45-434(-)
MEGSATDVGYQYFYRYIGSTDSFLSEHERHTGSGLVGFHTWNTRDRKHRRGLSHATGITRLEPSRISFVKVQVTVRQKKMWKPAFRPSSTIDNGFFPFGRYKTLKSSTETQQITGLPYVYQIGSFFVEL